MPEARRLEFDLADCLNLGKEAAESSTLADEQLCDRREEPSNLVRNLEATDKAQGSDGSVAEEQLTSRWDTLRDELCTVDSDLKQADCKVDHPRASETLHEAADAHDSELGNCREELLQLQEKYVAMRKIVQVQGGMLQRLQSQLLEEQEAFEETQAAWSWMSRQQEDELTALKEVVASVRAFGVAPEVAVALDIQQAEEASRVQDLEAALSDTKIEVLEAEQERVDWEERARRTQAEASAASQQERDASAAEMEHLETLLTEAEARNVVLAEKCEQQAGRAEEAEAKVAHLEDEMRAAKALWLESQQKERDAEEAAAFVGAQLAVAQFQVKLANFRLSEQQRLDTSTLSEAKPEPPSASRVSPSKKESFQIDGKENTWQPAVRVRLSSNCPLGKESMKQVSRMGSMRILPPHSALNNRPLSLNREGKPSQRQQVLSSRRPLSDVTNR